MEVSEPLIHKVFISFLFQNHLLVPLASRPVAGPVQKGITLGLFRLLYRAAGICDERSTFWVWRHVGLLDLSLNVETIFRICFFHRFRVRQLLLVNVRYLLMASQMADNWLFLLWIFWWEVKWAATETILVPSLTSVLLFWSLLRFIFEKISPELKLLFKVFQILVGDVIVVEIFVVVEDFLILSVVASRMRVWKIGLKGLLFCLLFFFLLYFLQIRSFQRWYSDSWLGIFFICFFFLSRFESECDFTFDFRVIQTLEVICAFLGYRRWEQVLLSFGKKRSLLISFLEKKDELARGAFWAFTESWGVVLVDFEENGCRTS